MKNDVYACENTKYSIKQLDSNFLFTPNQYN
jgi:hypothetical protein